MRHDQETNPSCAAVRAHVIRGEKVLLGLSAKRKDVWTTFGGALEGLESVEEALKREVREELGIEIVAYQRLPDRDRTWDDRPSRVAVFAVTEWQGTPLNCAPHEHEEIAWFARPDVESLSMMEPARSEALDLLKIATPR